MYLKLQSAQRRMRCMLRALKADKIEALHLSTRIIESRQIFAKLSESPVSAETRCWTVMTRIAMMRVCIAEPGPGFSYPTASVLEQLWALSGFCCMTSNKQNLVRVHGLEWQACFKWLSSWDQLYYFLSPGHPPKDRRLTVMVNSEGFMLVELVGES